MSRGESTSFNVSGVHIDQSGCCHRMEDGSQCGDPVSPRSLTGRCEPHREATRLLGLALMRRSYGVRGVH